ncbi:unnamed protein product [Protopolystoma xenopodis]|uniref:Choline/carnitine acyltransferase domain-containing protein n=1 Tax=Protopolystoma xenopodis TaxID=117903 RepID=A0A3S5BR94_9PLAT|nr:unnamed protein product [Protopolystoma xenopodis]
MNFQRPPLFLRGLIPLCSWQYERQFNTTRIPMPEKDVIVHWTSSYHISVYHKGRYFKCPLMHQGRQLLPAELEIMFQSILDETSLPAPGEEHLAAMTASPRDIWAATRATYLASDINRKTLEAVEKVSYFYCDETTNFSLFSTSNLYLFIHLWVCLYPLLSDPFTYLENLLNYCLPTHQNKGVVNLYYILFL